jgi:hypothetical protein
MVGRASNRTKRSSVSERQERLKAGKPGNAPADPSGIFSGMIIVAGSLAISGKFQINGLVYAINDLTYTGTGTGEIDGAVISQNVRDTSSTSIDTNTGGNASINYNCS